MFNHHDAEFDGAVFANRDDMWIVASPIAGLSLKDIQIFHAKISLNYHF